MPLRIQARYTKVVRLGTFGEILQRWAEQPCLLTLRIVATGTELRISGILRAYFSEQSLQGWALVPPLQHGGFTAIKMTELPFSESIREVAGDTAEPVLRFAPDAERCFELRRDRVPLCGPPRRVRTGRYLYTGGRRKPIPEPWMW